MDRPLFGGLLIASFRHFAPWLNLERVGSTRVVVITGNATVVAIRDLDDSDLAGGAKGKPPEAFGDFFKVLGDTLASMADHDAYHRGQLGLLAALD